MKKILALTIVFLMGIASFSIASSQEPCEDTLPSGCQECIFNDCMKSCSQPQTVDQYDPCDDCSYNAFFECQQRWFHPYWMEIYISNVKGCYARDLLCVNMPKSTQSCLAYCYESCGDMPFFNQCLESCESSECYLYGKQSYFEYVGGAEIKSLVINVPSCNDSRTFFNEPPPCAGEGDFSSEDRKLINSCCFDMRGCGSNPSLECATNCSGYNMPANYKCDVNEYVIMLFAGCGEIVINGVPLSLPTCEVRSFAVLANNYPHMVVWYNGERPFDQMPDVVMIQGVPRTITIEGKGRLLFSLEQKCCYDCKPNPSLPATILYPKVDIETFSVPGGETVIQDGKIISSFEMSPGSQQVFLQVENRGFFTQNDTRLRFDGLPEGVTVQTVPETQKLKAHNIGAYSALFTLGSNVPSGTYKVTMVAYSPSGVFDTATIDFVVS